MILLTELIPGGFREQRTQLSLCWESIVSVSSHSMQRHELLNWKVNLFVFSLDQLHCMHRRHRSLTCLSVFVSFNAPAHQANGRLLVNVGTSWVPVALVSVICPPLLALVDPCQSFFTVFSQCSMLNMHPSCCNPSVNTDQQFNSVRDKRNGSEEIK